MVSHSKEKGRLDFHKKMLRGKFRYNTEKITVDKFIQKVAIYVVSNIFRKIKRRKMRWAGYVACMGAQECTQNSGQKI